MKSSRRHVQNGIQGWRITAFLIGFGVIILIFSARLFNLQILQGEDWQVQSQENHTERISISTHRGVIYDRNGIILARNIASYNIAVTPALLPDDEGDIEEILRELSQYSTRPLYYDDDPDAEDILIQCGTNLGITEMVNVGLTFAPFEPVLVECDIERDRALAIMEKSTIWPGVGIEIDPVRDYPTGDLTSTFIGYLGPIPATFEEALRDQGFVPGRDKIGYGGLELYFDEVLRGKPGSRVVEVDVAGEVLRDTEGIVPPEAGLNLVLTIDTRFQAAVDAVLKREVNFWNTYFHGNSGEIRISSGVVIAMNPKTGEVLAMISWPTYENNRMARVIPAYYFEQLSVDATNPLLNHAVGAELPAGSVFKIVTGVGALNEKVVTPEQMVKTPPKITIQNVYAPGDPGKAKDFPDWNPAGFGQLNFWGGIANSSNVYFYKIGGGYEDEGIEGLGICRLGTYAEALGYNQLLGIELPDETDGLIPDPTWKRINQGENWSTGDTYIAGVGQGFMIASPMQVLMSAATVANNGLLIRPTIVREIVDGEGNTITVVMDEDGDILDTETDIQGNLIAHVWDENGMPIDLVVRDNQGVMYDYYYNETGDIIGQVYDEAGNPIRPVVISPFVPDVKWDLTEDHFIEKYENPAGIGSCKPTGEYVIIEPWVFQTVQEGMRQATIYGTLSDNEELFGNFPIPVAGKTGTAEYCDAVALSKNLCDPGNWPTHAWTVAYAPYDNPEIAVVAFLYNAGEGASVAGPVVRQVIEAYFNLKAIDVALGAP
ncbi:MAG: penicillin-binding transpeptidase domain-containing protein [Anaerolineales bacterium]|jgi:penicillin-binding protein 2